MAAEMLTFEQWSTRNFFIVRGSKAQNLVTRR